MRRPGPPRGGKEPAPGGAWRGTGTPGSACPGRAPRTGMEQRGPCGRGRCAMSPRTPQAALGWVQGWICGAPPSRGQPGFLPSRDESGGDELRETPPGRGPQPAPAPAPPENAEGSREAGLTAKGERGLTQRADCRASSRRRRRKKAPERWEGSHPSPAVWEDSAAEPGQSQLQGARTGSGGSDRAGEALTGCGGITQGAGGSGGVLGRSGVCVVDPNPKAQ